LIDHPPAHRTSNRIQSIGGDYHGMVSPGFDKIMNFPFVPPSIDGFFQVRPRFEDPHRFQSNPLHGPKKNNFGRHSKRFSQTFNDEHD
jgi:hypothetical protein